MRQNKRDLDMTKSVIIVQFSFIVYHLVEFRAPSYSHFFLTMGVLKAIGRKMDEAVYEKPEVR